MLETFNSTTFFPDLYNNLNQTITAPTVTTTMLWPLIPLFISTLLITFYLGTRLAEKHEWKLKQLNSVILIFVALDLLRYLYNNGNLTGDIDNVLNHPLRSFLVLIVGLYSLISLFYDFEERWQNNKLFNFIFSTNLINYCTYILIVVVYTGMYFNFAALISSVLIILTLLGLVEILKSLEGRFVKS